MVPKNLIIGVAGRSGSGKSSLVRQIQDHFGKEIVCLHAMDNYYRPEDEQLKDEHDYINWDLPASFYRGKYFNDLLTLCDQKSISLQEYTFNCKEYRTITITGAPIIITEGLFVFDYNEIREMMDYKVMMDVDFQTCYQRRLKRDQEERNYEVTEISHLYNNHAEPAYLKYIDPYTNEMDVLVKNENSFDEGLKKVIQRLEKFLEYATE